jgi:hypothetical protein
MNTDLLLRTTLDQGALYSVQRSPSALERRTALAALLYEAGIVTDPAVALRAFSLWTNPQVRQLATPERVLTDAAERRRITA